MVADEFWDLLDRTRPAAPDPAEHAAAITSALVDAGVEATVAFGRRFADAMAELYTWDLWGAGYVLLGGLSDDGFEYLRCWILGEGRGSWERARIDPEGYLVALVEELTPHHGDPVEGLADHYVGDGESLLYAAGTAHERLTGDWLPPDPVRARPDEPRGEEWDEDDLEERFPRLAAILDRGGSGTWPDTVSTGLPASGGLVDQPAWERDPAMAALDAFDAVQQAWSRGDHAEVAEVAALVLDDDERWQVLCSLTEDDSGEEIAAVLAYQGGIARLQIGDPDGAARWLRRAADLAPAGPEVRRALAQVELARGDLDAAQALLDTSPDAAPFDLALATALAGRRGDRARVYELAEALAAAVASVAGEPHPWDLAGMQVQVGQAMVEIGDGGRAMACARQALELTADAPPTLPLVPQARTLEAAAHRLAGDAGAARRALDEVWDRVDVDTCDRGMAERELARCQRQEGLTAAAANGYAAAIASFRAAGESALAEATEREAEREAGAGGI